MDYQHQYIQLNNNLHDSDADDKIEAIVNILPSDFLPKSVVDVACGSGKILIKISEILGSVNNVGIDISRMMISIAQKNDIENRIKWINCDIFDYDHEEFDLVLAIDIIEHLPDSSLFLSHLSKLGDLCILKVPIEDNIINRLAIFLTNGKINPLRHTELKYGHIKHYGHDDFITVITNSGYKVLRLDYLHLPKRSSPFWEILRWIFMPIWFVSEEMYIRLNGGFMVFLLQVDPYGNPKSQFSSEYT